MTSIRTLGTSCLITAFLALGACTATDDALVFEDTSAQTQSEPVTTPTETASTETAPVETAAAPATTPAPPPPTIQQTTSPQPATTAQPVATGPAQVYFAPIVGAPVDKVTTLSQRLSAASGQKGIQLQPARTQTTTNEIR
ncbi:MAG: hypothetical protein AAF940_16225, partial [Pseudomonadota bacterium]